MIDETRKRVLTSIKAVPVLRRSLSTKKKEHLALGVDETISRNVTSEFSYSVIDMTWSETPAAAA